MDRLIGTDGTPIKFAEEARNAIREADVLASGQAARDAADRTSLAPDDPRRSLPEIRDTLAQLRELARRLDEQPESVVYGPHQPKQKSRSLPWAAWRFFESCPMTAWITWPLRRASQPKGIPA